MGPLSYAECVTDGNIMQCMTVYSFTRSGREHWSAAKSGTEPLEHRDSGWLHVEGMKAFISVTHLQSRKTQSQKGPLIEEKREARVI